jgi:hypothetical protein
VQEPRTPVVSPPHVLWWCRTAEDESRTFNYVLNGAVILAAFLAAIAEVGIRHGDVVNSLHLKSLLDYMHQLWHAYEAAVEANPVVTKVPSLLLSSLPA